MRGTQVDYGITRPNVPKDGYLFVTSDGPYYYRRRHGWTNFLSGSTFSDVNVLLKDGSVASPSLAFYSDTDTGIYKTGTANELRIVTGGTTRFIVRPDGRIRIVTAGTAALPTLVRSADSNTGIWWPTADNLALSTGGTEAIRWNSSQQTVVIAGSAAAPSLTFSGDTGTGIYQAAANTVGISCGGTLVAFFSGGGQLDLYGVAPSLTLQDTSSGADAFSFSAGPNNELKVERNGSSIGEWDEFDNFIISQALIAQADEGNGSGYAGANCYTGETDTPTTDPGWTSSSTVNMNAPDGYIKVWVGTQAAVIPYWNT